VKGFNHLIAAKLAADPIVEGGHRVVFLRLGQIVRNHRSHDADRGDV
jgi:hypothetical protein